MEILTRIAAFIQERDFAVLSTLSPDGPWVSLMSYLPGPDGLTVFLAMAEGSSKAGFIRNDPRVALLIDDRRLHGDPVSITALGVHGTAGFVIPPREREGLVRAFLGRRPHLADLLARPDTGIVRVTPKSFQLLEGVDKGSFVVLGESGWRPG